MREKLNLMLKKAIDKYKETGIPLVRALVGVALVALGFINPLALRTGLI